MTLSPSLSPNPSAVLPPPSTGHPNDEASILKFYMRGMAYEPPNIDGTNVQLESAMRAEMEARNLQCNQLERTLHLSASLIEFAYPECNFAEKKIIALFNWYVIYVDDMIPKNTPLFSEFGQRFLNRKPQLDPVLDAFSDLLHGMWEIYDPLSANSIIAGVFEFITCSCIETEVEAMPLVRGGHRFPWFLRERTSVAGAYTLMLFPKRRNVNYLEYIQAIPDMTFWTSLTNDILSFHKEELAGDKENYVHTRACVENTTPLKVLNKMASELNSARNIILSTLVNSPDALRTWKAFERGCVAWHMTQERYKLNDLDLCL